MSQQNVETIRAITDAYNRGDFDTVREIGDPDFVLVPPGGQPPIEGADGVRAWMEPDAFESQVVDLLDLRVAGNKVLVRTRSKIRGAGSGIELEFLGWAVWTFNEAGRPIRLEVYLDHEKAQALKAAGLEE
jgi:ketosteroid isomerase-like protein